MLNNIHNIIHEINLIPEEITAGKVISIRGLLIEASGLEKTTSIGSRCKVINRNGENILAEVVGVKQNATLLMPFQDLIGTGVGCDVIVSSSEYSIYPSKEWLGRVINAFGEPIDFKGILPKGKTAYHLRNRPIPSHMRQRVGGKINIGIRAINAFLSCCKGQRLGIFAGSGVGKSVMLAMMTKFAETDIKVIGLIGERGREVQEFIEDYLGEEGLSKAVVVVATSDESALARKQAAYLTLALSEYYRDIGMHVLCILDNITRFAMALREIGLTIGEPITSKSYTPSVFSELPKLLERAGPGTQNMGFITGLFSVLVEGDDHNEPIADAVRGILDGHIVLDRKISIDGIYPSIDILASISRIAHKFHSEYERNLIQKACKLISDYRNMSDMIKIGAYKIGSNTNIDEAIKYHDAIDQFISQRPSESDDLQSSYEKLARAINFHDK